ncbi:fatty acid-binding protein, intestinal-like [Paramormyrops kingsleyae]|uniref:Fatty acid binding protein 2 n=1 Tax=Paramormyrops kingsleyae TaxID=1676925 RepID=A0A3B3RLP3_9TELE|nr:fatty acid-binding protein, intestinal-like [Paramormyrops kingsleyae]
MTFNGSWKVEQSENFANFLEQMGINVVKRKLAEHDNMKLIIEQTGDNFHIKESSTFRKKDFNFTLGVPFEHELADGTVIEGTWVLEGNTLKGNFTRKDNGKTLLTNREVTGNELVQTYSYDGVTAKRIFKKV